MFKSSILSPFMHRNIILKSAASLLACFKIKTGASEPPFMGICA